MSLYFFLVKDLIVLVFIYYQLSNAILLAWLKKKKKYQLRKSCLSLNTIYQITSVDRKRIKR